MSFPEKVFVFFEKPCCPKLFILVKKPTHSIPFDINRHVLTEKLLMKHKMCVASFIIDTNILSFKEIN